MVSINTFATNLHTHSTFRSSLQVSSQGATEISNLATQRRKRSNADATAKLRDAAVELVRESPFDIVTMSEVAKRARDNNVTWDGDS
jgi:uncharacterized membrane protein